MHELLESQAGITIAELRKRSPLAAAGIAVKAEPIVENQYRTPLQKISGELQHVDRGLVKIAIDVQYRSTLRKKELLGLRI